VATWKRKLAGEPLVDRELPFVLAELAKEPPEFHLPPATLGHTRHFMPWFKKGPEDRTLVFDAFIAIDPEREVVFHWRGAVLSNDGRRALDLVLSQLGYFGRAESWVAARLPSEFDLRMVNCAPGRSHPGDETVRVLVADPSSWNGWSFEEKRVHRPDPLWNLLAETADMQQEKWSDAPGSRWVSYARRPDCFEVVPGPRSSTQSAKAGYTVARFAIDGPVLPLVEDTLPLAEQARRALMSNYQFLRRRAKYGPTFPADAVRFNAPVFSGKGEDHRPLRDSHRHAFYLPTDEDGDGRLDHITLFAQQGFGQDDAVEIQAIDRMRRLRFQEGELSLLLVGLTAVDGLSAPRLFGPASVWESATPYLTTRHLKRRGRKRDPREWFETREGQTAFVERVLWEDLQRRGLGDAAIASLGSIGPRRLLPLQFRLSRFKRGDNGSQRPRGAFRLTFPSPVSGPIALGHSCHFGLGLFLPADPTGR
jgi:CRISPR-associated protein Csb2